MQVKGKIRVGTSSWSDPGFVADWYPPKLPAAARLAWYAEHFDYVEVNSSFYAISQERVVQRWDTQTPAGFLFDVKLYGLLSRHAVKPESLPPDLRRGVGTNTRGSVILTPELEHAAAQRFRAEIAPLRECGKLGALLLQLSPAFSPRDHRLDELEQLIGIFREDRLAIELRNRHWLTGSNRSATLDFLAARNLPLVVVDAPASEHLTIMPVEDNITSPALAYLRLHGRNERGYIEGKSVAERFDYDYSEEEIKGIAGRVRELARNAQEVHVAFNNNRSSYAPKAALALRATLAQAGRDR